MKVLILAAGYGTRLERDLQLNGNYKELQGVPKPLLPVAGKPVVSHWLDILAACPETQGGVYVMVNDANKHHFDKWGRGHHQVRVGSDGTSTNEGRLGAVACIELAVRMFDIQDHLLVIGGDTLFLEDFSLSMFLRAFHSSSAAECDGAFIPFYNCSDEDAPKRGIIEVNEEGKVTNFLEKPNPEDTTSRKANPCFYLYTQKALPLLTAFLEEKKDCPLKERDATGNFVKYLYTKRPVYTVEISGRYDIGGLDSYLQCCAAFTPHIHQE